MALAFRSEKGGSEFGNNPDQHKPWTKLRQPSHNDVWSSFQPPPKGQGLIAALLSRAVAKSCHRLIFSHHQDHCVLKEQLTPRPSVSQYPGEDVISY